MNINLLVLRFCYSSRVTLASVCDCLKISIKTFVAYFSEQHKLSVVYRWFINNHKNVNNNKCFDTFLHKLIRFLSNKPSCSANRVLYIGTNEHLPELHQ